LVLRADAFMPFGSTDLSNGFLKHY
jgi:hypothetical protein